MNTKTLWLELCHKLAKEQPTIRLGARKIFRKQEWIIPNLDDSINLATFGYTPTKMKHLMRYYWHEESIARARSDYLDRVHANKHGSGALHFHGQQKGGFTKQGHCIQGMVLTYAKKETYIDIFYRTTELPVKFGGDLIFFKDKILPYFEEGTRIAPIKEIRFLFVNITMHSMFYPITVAHDKKWEGELDEIRDSDPHFWRHILKWSWLYFMGPDSKYIVANRTRDNIKELMSDTRARKFIEYLEENYEAI